MREINDAGLQLVAQWEGLSLKAYHGEADRPGLLTIGYGHTSAAGLPKVYAGQIISKQEAEEILRRDLQKSGEAVSRLVKVSLNDNQFAALNSFVFNVGEGAFAGSTLLHELNAGDYDAVPAQLMRWVNSNGRRQTGLVHRRAAESALWAKGAYVASNFVKPDAVA